MHSFHYTQGDKGPHITFNNPQDPRKTVTLTGWSAVNFLAQAKQDAMDALIPLRDAANNVVSAEEVAEETSEETLEEYHARVRGLTRKQEQKMFEERRILGLPDPPVFHLSMGSYGITSLCESQGDSLVTRNSDVTCPDCLAILKKHSEKKVPARPTTPEQVSSYLRDCKAEGSNYPSSVKCFACSSQDELTHLPGGLLACKECFAVYRKHLLKIIHEARPGMADPHLGRSC